MWRPGPRQGQPDSGCSMGTARPAAGTSACSGSAWPKQGISKTQHESAPSLVVGSSIPTRRKPFLSNWGFKEMWLCPFLSPGALSHKCLPVSPPSLFLPALQAEGLAWGPCSSQEIFSTEFCFWYYFYTLVLSSHIGSASRFWSLKKNLIHLLWKALHSPSQLCLPHNQHRVPWLCLRSAPQVTCVTEGVTHPWSPAHDPGLGTTADAGG